MPDSAPISAMLNGLRRTRERKKESASNAKNLFRL
jgi:hypothetical protein